MQIASNEVLCLIAVKLVSWKMCEFQQSMKVILTKKNYWKMQSGVVEGAGENWQA